MSAYLPPLHINQEFNPTEYDYQMKPLSLQQSESRYLSINNKNIINGLQFFENQVTIDKFPLICNSGLIISGHVSLNQEIDPYTTLAVNGNISSIDLSNRDDIAVGGTIAISSNIFIGGDLNIAGSSFINKVSSTTASVKSLQVAGITVGKYNIGAMLNASGVSFPMVKSITGNSRVWNTALDWMRSGTANIVLLPEYSFAVYLNGTILFFVDNSFRHESYYAAIPIFQEFTSLNLYYKNILL
jgi:hypothetical protein